jgi:hypothetical protein
LSGKIIPGSAFQFHLHTKEPDMAQAQGSGGAVDQAQGAAGKKIWVTLSGLPLTFRLDWPFHASTSGADFWVLHGDIQLAGSEGLHAPVAVNLSQTVREIMPSLDPKDAEAPVINALRKEVDRRQIEFLKSGKLLPVPFSSRHYDFKRDQWIFGKASDEAIAQFVERKVYWESKLNQATRVWMGDPADAQYLQTNPTHLLEVAARLVAAQGLIRIDGEHAEATQGLISHSDRFEDARRAAVEELEKKHAYERA